MVWPWLWIQDPGGVSMVMDPGAVFRIRVVRFGVTALSPFLYCLQAEPLFAFLRHPLLAWLMCQPATAVLLPCCVSPTPPIGLVDVSACYCRATAMLRFSDTPYWPG